MRKAGIPRLLWTKIVGHQGQVSIKSRYQAEYLTGSIYSSVNDPKGESMVPRNIPTMTALFVATTFALAGSAIAAGGAGVV